MFDSLYNWALGQVMPAIRLGSLVMIMFCSISSLKMAIDIHRGHSEVSYTKIASYVICAIAFLCLRLFVSGGAEFIQEHLD